MNLVEILRDFAGAVSDAATHAPDEYPEWSYRSYDMTRTDIQKLWAQIRPKLKRDVDKVSFIDEKIAEAFAAFDSGDKERGRKTMWRFITLGSGSCADQRLLRRLNEPDIALERL